MNGGWAQAAKGALEFSRRQSGQTGEGGAPGESGARAARGASGVQALGMLALFEAKREREKRLGLARDASVSSEHERKLATLPSWMLTLEKTALREAWARWLNNKAAADSVKAWGPARFWAGSTGRQKKQLMARQLAVRSKWDEPKYNASALKRALADTILVDAGWLAALADHRGTLPRCQEVPTDVVVSLEEMERCTFGFDELLPVLVISSPWLNPDHPDEHGVLLRSISFVLRAFAKRAAEEGGRCGVFWDYCSVPQRSLHAPTDDKTFEEQKTFARSLSGMGSWYGHPLTSVLLVNIPPPKGRHTNLQPYELRGWCDMEARASSLVKDVRALISLKRLSGEETRWVEVKDRGRAQRAPPRPPDAFAEGLKAGVEQGELRLSDRNDLELVSRIYREAFDTEMRCAVALQNSYLGWDDITGVAFCEGLQHAHRHGWLRKLKRLELKGNRLGDNTVEHLVGLVDQTGLANLDCLLLGGNAISDQGMRALASALARGGLPSCTTIELEGNPGDAAPVQEALAQRQK